MFTISSMRDLLLSVPALLGFIPVKSLVAVTVTDGAVGMCVRVDLAYAEEAADQIASVAQRNNTSDVTLVFVDAAASPESVGGYEETAAHVAAAFDAQGIGVRGVAVVDVLSTGGRWFTIDGSGQSGVLDDPTTTDLAMAAIVEGRRVTGSRSELVALVQPDPQRAGVLAPLIASAAVVERERAVSTALEVAHQLAGGEQVADAVLAELGAALGDGVVRDGLYGLAVTDAAPVVEALWMVLARSLPSPQRADALVLLAVSAWIRGDGVLAGIAIGEALDEVHDHKMAGMLDCAMSLGIEPKKLRQMIVSATSAVSV